MALVCPGLTVMNIRLRDLISDLPQTNDVLSLCCSQGAARKVAILGSSAAWVGMASHGTVAALLLGHQLGQPGDFVGESVKIQVVLELENCA